MPKCIICGAENPTVKLCTANKNIYNFCQSCLMSGVEPYEDLVKYGMKFDWVTESFRNKILIPTLQYNQKTIEEFNADVEKEWNNE